MTSFRVKLHRIISWSLVASFIATIITGYAQTQNWFPNKYLLSTLHRVFEWIFIPLILYHTIYTLKYVKIRTKMLVDKIKERKGTTINSLRLVQKISSWGIIISVFLIILSGLNGYVWFANTFGTIIPFSLHRTLDFILNIFILIHIAVGLKFLLIRKKIQKKIIDYSIVFFTIFLISGFLYLQLPDWKTVENPQETPSGDAIVNIGGVDYIFNTSEVETVRSDLFQPGHFSMFDVLVELDNLGSINLTYHFDSSMNTHVIDSLNGKQWWWYQAYYTGGWPEKNVYRMDHYPWREGTTLRFFEESDPFIQSVYTIWKEEVERKNNNGGQVIIPTVTIRGNSFQEEFNNIVVTAHDLRNDTFQNGVITAIDVIMTLGDLGLITYRLQWYESIGSAGIVKSYWVDQINSDSASGTCGFVYESGSYNFQGFAGNHIHIPQDSRPLNSPEYYLTFWICL